MRASSAMLLTAPLLCMVSTAQSARTTTLAGLRDTSRPLLIFAPANDPRLQEQLRELSEHEDGLRDRDMCIVLLSGPSKPALGSSPLPLRSFTPQDQVSARQRFHVALGAFTVVLVGKDGGSKLRSSQPIPWQKLASTIDGMPMRRQEMKQR